MVGRRVVVNPGSNNSDVFAVGFSHDGTTLATSDEDSTYLWKV